MSNTNTAFQLDTNYCGMKSKYNYGDVPDSERQIHIQARIQIHEEGKAFTATDANA